MALKLMYITNNVNIAKIAEDSGVDWIFIDLEINGKEERQAQVDSVISGHSIDDVKKIKSILTRSELLVRINPIFEGSKKEIDQVIKNGADIIMLPFFKIKDEVDYFMELVNKRVKTCLLVETPEAVEIIDKILEVDGIDYIYIGLNDLHLGYKMKFMFELLADGTVENLCRKFNEKDINYGFGGIAKLGHGILPAERVIAEHYRLGSTIAILSRTFCNTNQNEEINRVKEVFITGILDIRSFENKISNETVDFFESNKALVVEKVNEIVKNIN